MSEPTDAGIQDPGGPQRPARRIGARMVWITCIVLAVVLVLATGAAVWFGVAYAHQDRALAQTPPATITLADARTLDDARRLDFGLMLGAVGVTAVTGGLAILTF